PTGIFARPLVSVGVSGHCCPWGVARLGCGLAIRLAVLAKPAVAAVAGNDPLDRLAGPRRTGLAVQALDVGGDLLGHPALAILVSCLPVKPTVPAAALLGAFGRQRQVLLGRALPDVAERLALEAEEGLAGIG